MLEVHLKTYKQYSPTIHAQNKSYLFSVSRIVLFFFLFSFFFSRSNGFLLIYQYGRIYFLSHHIRYAQTA